MRKDISKKARQRSRNELFLLLMEFDFDNPVFPVKRKPKAPSVKAKIALMFQNDEFIF